MNIAKLGPAVNFGTRVSVSDTIYKTTLDDILSVPEQANFACGLHHLENNGKDDAATFYLTIENAIGCTIRYKENGRVYRLNSQMKKDEFSNPDFLSPRDIVRLYNETASIMSYKKDNGKVAPAMAPPLDRYRVLKIA